MMTTVTLRGIGMDQYCHPGTAGAPASVEARTNPTGALGKTESSRVEQAQVVRGFELDRHAICRTDRDDASWCS